MFSCRTADPHEIEESETLRLRQAAQNIALPHYGGIAVSRTSGGYEPENAGKSEDSQNKCISNWVVAMLRKCHVVEMETRKESHKRPPILVLPAAPPSQSHDGTEVTNQRMLDAGIAYPPSSSPDTFSRPVSLRSSMSPGQLDGLSRCSQIVPLGGRFRRVERGSGIAVASGDHLDLTPAEIQVRTCQVCDAGSKSQNGGGCGAAVLTVTHQRW